MFMYMYCIHQFLKLNNSTSYIIKIFFMCLKYSFRPGAWIGSTPAWRGWWARRRWGRACWRGWPSAARCPASSPPPPSTGRSPPSGQPSTRSSSQALYQLILLPRTKSMPKATWSFCQPFGLVQNLNSVLLSDHWSIRRRDSVFSWILCTRNQLWTNHHKS